MSRLLDELRRSLALWLVNKGMRVHAEETYEFARSLVVVVEAQRRGAVRGGR